MEVLKEGFSAKELYSCLELRKDFGAWMKQKIELLGLVKDQDYVKTGNYRRPVFVDGKDIGGRPENDYRLSIDTVMKIVMSSEKADFATKSRLMEKCILMKNREAIDTEIYEAKYRFASDVGERNRIIKGLLKVIEDMTTPDTSTDV